MLIIKTYLCLLFIFIFIPKRRSVLTTNIFIQKQLSE